MTRTPTPPLPLPEPEVLYEYLPAEALGLPEAQGTLAVPRLDLLAAVPLAEGGPLLARALSGLAADQPATWPRRALRPVVEPLQAGTSPVDVAVDRVISAYKALIPKWGRLITELTKLPLQIVPELPVPLVLASDRLVMSPLGVLALHEGALHFLLLAHATALHFGATSRADHFARTQTAHIDGRPVTEEALAYTAMAQAVAFLRAANARGAWNVPGCDVLGCVVAPALDGGEEEELLLVRAGAAPDVTEGIGWQDPFPDAYGRVYDRIQKQDQNQPDPQGQEGQQGQQGQQGQDPDQDPAGQGQGRQGQDDQEGQQDPAGQGQGRQDQDQGQGQDPQDQKGQGQGRPAPVLSRDEATRRFGPAPMPGTDVSPSEQTGRQVRAELAQKLAGTEAGDALRGFAEPPAPTPRLADALERWAVQVEHRLRDDARTWMRPDAKAWRRYRVFEPSSATPVCGPVVVIIDTSGSMAETDLREAVAALHGMQGRVLPEAVWVVACDTRPAHVLFCERVDALDPERLAQSFSGLRLTGGGGTDMGAGIEWVLGRGRDTVVPEYGVPVGELMGPPELVVVLTDGYTPWCEDPGVPVVVATTDRPGPGWAETVYLGSP